MHNSFINGEYNNSHIIVLRLQNSFIQEEVEREKEKERERERYRRGSLEVCSLVGLLPAVLDLVWRFRERERKRERGRHTEGIALRYAPLPGVCPLFFISFASMCAGSRSKSSIFLIGNSASLAFTASLAMSTFLTVF